VVLQELSNCFGAGLTLEILSLNDLVEELQYLSVRVINAESLDYSYQDWLHSLQVPILVNACSDDWWVEDGLNLGGEEVAEIVHDVEVVGVFKLLDAILGKYLFRDGFNQGH
jgi:hypothetical protein